MAIKRGTPHCYILVLDQRPITERQKSTRLPAVLTKTLFAFKHVFKDLVRTTTWSDWTTRRPLLDKGITALQHTFFILR